LLLVFSEMLSVPPKREGHELSRRASIYTAISLIAAIAAFTIPYHLLTRRVDRQLATGTFQHGFTYYGAPEAISVGDAFSLAELATTLQHAGIPFHSTDRSIVIHSQEPVEIGVANGAVASVSNLRSHMRFLQYELPPQMINNIDEGRSRRVMVQYADLPPVLVEAVVSAEDKRFFAHSGLDTLRIAKALYVDVRERRKEQGASTISMQLARNLWLEREKKWRRKVAETLITLHLERKLTKKQIFEDYANSVYLGGDASFSICGFGEAARAYFNKDVRNLTLTESATLAGIIQRPSYFNPLHYPERALDRRNVVLTMMQENNFISGAQYLQAINAPLGVHPGASAAAAGQYFLDLAGTEAMHDLD